MEDRELIRRLGGDLVVFFNADIDMVESWRDGAHDFPRDLAVVADQRAAVYDGLATRRSGSYLQLARGSIGPVITSARERRFPRLTKADMLRLGADAAVRPDGEIALLHRARSPDDRLALPELVGALG